MILERCFKWLAETIFLGLVTIGSSLETKNEVAPAKTASDTSTLTNQKSETPKWAYIMAFMLIAIAASLVLYFGFILFLYNPVLFLILLVIVLFAIR